mmetsp:Transcript_74752/g.161689  ORF Transcript_74752/g.161689 Transcript_74752/m.161689 type:complete len:226 (-) Transcript_74752:1627-2304(-)
MKGVAPRNPSGSRGNTFSGPCAAVWMHQPQLTCLPGSADSPNTHALLNSVSSTCAAHDAAAAGFLPWLRLNGWIGGGMPSTATFPMRPREELFSIPAVTTSSPTFLVEPAWLELELWRPWRFPPSRVNRSKRAKWLFALACAAAVNSLSSFAFMSAPTSRSSIVALVLPFMAAMWIGVRFLLSLMFTSAPHSMRRQMPSRSSFWAAKWRAVMPSASPEFTLTPYR